MTSYLSQMTTIAFYFLFAFLFNVNDASKKTLQPHTTKIGDLNKSEMTFIMKFLTLREALKLSFVSKQLEHFIPEVTEENIKYFKPFLGHGYDKNIGFTVSKYCSTLNDDAAELQIINKNIHLIQEYDIYHNSWVFIFPLTNLNVSRKWRENKISVHLSLCGGIGEYEENVPTKILENVEGVVETNQAICVLFGDGTVAAWGNPLFGGKIPETIKPFLKNIRRIESTDGAFAALSHDRKVFVWGHPLYGGEISEHIQPLLHNIRYINPNKKAFAAVKYDGNVFSWGDPNHGGNPSEEIKDQLYNVDWIFRTPARENFRVFFNDGRKPILLA